MASKFALGLLNEHKLVCFHRNKDGKILGGNECLQNLDSPCSIESLEKVTISSKDTCYDLSARKWRISWLSTTQRFIFRFADYEKEG